MTNAQLVFAALGASLVTVAAFVVALFYLRPLLESMGFGLSPLGHEIGLLVVAAVAMAIASTPVRRELRRRASKKARSGDA
jgi:hypothetical protein